MSPTAMPLLLLLTLLAGVVADSHTEKHHHHHQHRRNETVPDLVRSSCEHASYPTVCLRSLASYSGPADSPRELAQAAVRVSLTRARRVRKYLAGVSADGPGSRSAVGDCVEQVSDSMDDLSRTLAELQHLRGETFQWQMSNAETWVSAALTSEDTCLDGFEEVTGTVRTDVKRKISNIAKVTSNALYMINRLDESRSGRPHHSTLGRP